MDKIKLFLICVIAFILFFIILIIVSRMQILRIYKKYLKIKNHTKTNGRSLAISMNNFLKLNINLAVINGTLSDCYNPKTKTLMISSEILESDSIASLAIISHEMGHAVQDKSKNPLFIIVNQLQKITFLSNKLILPSLFTSLIFILINLNTFHIIFNFFIFLFALNFLKNLLLIPLEINASKFALNYLKENKYLNFNEVFKVKKILKIASRTYIANFFDNLLLIKIKFKRRKK